MNNTLLPLIKLSQNSLNDVYIYNEKFDLQWSNTETALDDEIIASQMFEDISKIEKEKIISCENGSALRIIPFDEFENERYYYIELFKSSSALELVSKTGAYKKFIGDFFSAQYSFYNIISSLRTNSDNFFQREIDEYLSDNANNLALIEILSSNSKTHIADLNKSLNFIGQILHSLKKFSDNFKFSIEVDDDILVKADAASLEFVLINLFTNAYIHSGATDRVILINAYTQDDCALIEINDNGVDADLKSIESSRELSKANNDNDKKGMGIALAQIFCDIYDGSLNFKKLPGGGLSASVKIPLADISECDFNAKQTKSEAQMEIIEELIKKCIDNDSLNIF